MPVVSNLHIYMVSLRRKRGACRVIIAKRRALRLSLSSWAEPRSFV